MRGALRKEGEGEHREEGAPRGTRGVEQMKTRVDSCSGSVSAQQSFQHWLHGKLPMRKSREGWGGRISLLLLDASYPL